MRRACSMFLVLMALVALTTLSSVSANTDKQDIDAFKVLYDSDLGVCVVRFPNWEPVCQSGISQETIMKVRRVWEAGHPQVWATGVVASNDRTYIASKKCVGADFTIFYGPSEKK